VIVRRSTQGRGCVGGHVRRDPAGGLVRVENAGHAFALVDLQIGSARRAAASRLVRSMFGVSEDADEGGLDRRCGCR
jgi:hypothetical protein